MCYPENMVPHREPKRMTTSRRKIEAYDESRFRDRQAIALLAGEPITAESLAAAYQRVFDLDLTSPPGRRKIER